ncbi:MAG: EsaB/YukD family protein, partial [Ornithinimicrobium sp.]
MSIVVGPYLRATVLSDRRRLDVVLPTDQPVAEVLPALLDLLGVCVPGTVSMLHTDAGQRIDMDRSLRQSALLDGAVLHLVPVREAPAEPVVTDLIDVFETDDYAGRYGPAAQQWLLAAGGATLFVLGGAAVCAAAGPWA